MAASGLGCRKAFVGTRWAIFLILCVTGDVVMVKGEIMHEPKTSALATRDCYYIARVH